MKKVFSLLFLLIATTGYAKQAVDYNGNLITSRGITIRPQTS